MENAPRLVLRKGLPTKKSLTALLAYFKIEHVSLLYLIDGVGISHSRREYDERLAKAAPIIESYGFTCEQNPYTPEQLLRGRLTLTIPTA